MGKLLGVLFVSKRFGTFSKSHKAAQLFFACLTSQQAAWDNRKTFFLKLDNSVKIGLKCRSQKSDCVPEQFKSNSGETFNDYYVFT